MSVLRSILIIGLLGSSTVFAAQSPKTTPCQGILLNDPTLDFAVPNSVFSNLDLAKRVEILNQLADRLNKGLLAVKLSSSQAANLALRLKSINAETNRNLQPHSESLLSILVKMTPVLLHDQNPSTDFRERVLQFVRKVIKISKSSSQAHLLSHAYGTLILLQSAQLPNSSDVVGGIQLVLSDLRGRALDRPEFVISPLMFLVQAAVQAPINAENLERIDNMLTPLVVGSRSVVYRMMIEARETSDFRLYLSVVDQIEALRREPQLRSYPALESAVHELVEFVR